MGLRSLLSGLTALWCLLAAPADAADANLTVDLEYGVYTGVLNTATRLNVWRGIRYAAAPVGKLRWQAPQTPATDRTVVVANAFGPTCPQSFPSFPTTANTFVAGNEDCLNLNVYSPVRSTDALLPVMVWIHGGGYGLGDGKQDLSAFINTNDNALVAVAIQYRLGAFGFASSPEIKSRGVLNAGLLDQKFALQWIQKHIAKFGGDPNRVTITGESAGAGSALLHSIAQNGSLGTTLFKNIIAASPWIPTQPYFDDAIPTQHYRDFARAAGCTTSGEVFDCLVGKDSTTLQRASTKVSSTSPTPYGNWAFIPVTDGSYNTGPPSVLLNQRKVNGLRLLVGNNANEGVILVRPNIVTQNDLVAWIKEDYSRLSDANITRLLTAYASTSAAVNSRDPRYETSGTGPGTAVNVSQVATGQQQRAFNMYAEGSVVCPSYWFGTAFTSPGHAAYHYQYSVPFAAHGADIAAYWGPATDNIGPEFVTAMRRIFGNFVTKDNPSIESSIASGSSSSAAANPASSWPAWTDSNPMMINLNQTGGTPYSASSATGVTVTQFRQPGLRNDIKVANAYTWEGGRGQRCEAWRELSPFVPQ